MRDLVLEPAHLPHVLLVVHRVDDRAGAEEQQRLEEGVGEEVEDARRIDPCPERDEHVAELRAGRIGDDALDVVLDEADGRREERGERADDRAPSVIANGDASNSGDRRATMKTPAVTMVAAWISARDRGRALHRVRQPGVERHLRRLAHGAHEQQQADHGHRVVLAAEEADGRVARARRRHGRRRRNRDGRGS